MGKKRRRTGRRGPRTSRGRPHAVRVRKIPGEQAWELVHPRCARERAEDIEEVQEMIDGGEAEIAVEELRWLLGGCHDFLEAHMLLGAIALSESEDLGLARGHFGYAYQLGLTAVRRAGMPSPLPYVRPANQAFFEAGKGLAHSLQGLGKTKMAREVLQTLLKLDPSDPLGLHEMRARLDETGGISE